MSCLRVTMETSADPSLNRKLDLASLAFRRLNNSHVSDIHSFICRDVED